MYFDYVVFLDELKGKISAVNSENLKKNSEVILDEIDSMIKYYHDNFPYNQLGLPDFWMGLVAKLKNLLTMLEKFPPSITNPVKSLKRHYENEIEGVDHFLNDARRSGSRSRSRSRSRNKNRRRNSSRNNRNRN